MENIGKTNGYDPGNTVIHALIVDDEMGAVNTLRGMLNTYCPHVRIAGAVFSVEEALNSVSVVQPELVFLDIEMPPLGSGFDFLKRCQEINFGVIFTTAYPEYAIEAINLVQPWAYLIKPYSVSELKSAVAVAVEKIKRQQLASLQAAERQGIIIQDSRKGTLVVRAGEIVYCEADGSFTDFVIYKNQRLEKITSSRNLGEFEMELPPLLFCRTHHSFLINLAFVSRFERTGRNGLVHFSCPCPPVDVSVSKLEIFVRRLEEYQSQLQGE